VPEIPHGEVGDATTSFPDTQLQQEEGAEEASTPGQLNEDHTTPDLDIHKVQPTNDQSDLGNLESDTSPTLSAIAAAVLELTKTGSEYTMGDIRNYLIGHGYMTEDQWKGRNPQFFSKIQNEIVKHLQTQGVKGEWDFRGNTKARVHFLFIARESSNPVALGRLFPTPKQPKPTQDHIHTPRRATVEIPPTPHTTAPHPKHPPTREDRHMATQIERQRESERAVVVRDLTRHLADGEGGRDVDNRWNAVLRTLQTAHPSINIEQIMSGLVESGAYHTVRSNGSKLIYPGPAPETSVVQAPKRGKFEPIGRPDVDFVKENPDIAEQVHVYLATTFTHHTEGETMSTLFDKYGDGLTKEEFNRLLRQGRHAQGGDGVWTGQRVEQSRKPRQREGRSRRRRRPRSRGGVGVRRGLRRACAGGTVGGERRGENGCRRNTTQDNRPCMYGVARQKPIANELRRHRHGGAVLPQLRAVAAG
jgi:hypothetical protein